MNLPQRSTMLLAALALLLVPAAAVAQSEPFLVVHTAQPGRGPRELTLLTDPRLAGHDELVVLATQVYGVYNPHPVAVQYVARARQWAVVNTDRAPMPRQASFHVLALPPSTPGAFVHVALPGNLQDYWTVLDQPAANGNPRAVVLVTPMVGSRSPHPVGVWFSNGRWNVFNQDRAPMPVGAQFNVFVTQPGFALGGEASLYNAGAQGVVHRTGRHTWTTDSVGRDAVPFVTQNFGLDGPYNPHEVGVWDDGQRWTVFNEDLRPLPPGVAFNLLALPRSGPLSAMAPPLPEEPGAFAGPVPTFPRGPATSPIPPAAPTLLPTGVAGAAADRSLRSERPVAVTFNNNANGPVDLVWLDFQGNERPFGSLATGGRQTLSTFESHAWRYRQGGTTVGLYVAGSAPEQSTNVLAMPALPPPPAPPQLAPSLVNPDRSLRSERKVTVTFANNSNGPAQLAWLDFQGNERGYGSVAAGGRQTLSTFETHVWRWRQGGGVVATYVVNDQPEQLANLLAVPTAVASPPASDRSLRSDRKVEVTFTNNATGPVELDWVDFQGVERGFGNIDAGQRQTLQTYETHAWRFKQGGVVVGSYVASGEPQQATSVLATPALAGYPTRQVRPRWVAATAGMLVADALAAGSQDGQPLYVCRAPYGSGTHPGKVWGQNCNFGYGGKEVIGSRYEVLVDAPNSSWVAGEGGSLPAGAFVGGRESGAPLYVCRGRYNGGLHPGKLVGQGCNVGWGGSEMVLPSYEVLVVSGFAE